MKHSATLKKSFILILFSFIIGIIKENKSSKIIIIIAPIKINLSIVFLSPLEYGSYILIIPSLLYCVKKKFFLFNVSLALQGSIKGSILIFIFSLWAIF